MRTITIDKVSTNQWDTGKGKEFFKLIIKKYNLSDEDAVKLVDELKNIADYMTEIEFQRRKIIMQVKSADGYIIKVIDLSK